MKFKPFGTKYKFDNTVLVRNYPNYMFSSIENWLWTVFRRADVVDTDTYSNERYVKGEFLNVLRIEFREVFPQSWNDFFRFSILDSERMSNILAFCLQKFSDGENAADLEYILSTGGSGYKVYKTDSEASEYKNGVYDLMERVPETIQEESKKALNCNQTLMDAWKLCYSRNPDYEKVVIKCQNFLEEFLRNKYEPQNSKPQLGKLIGNLKTAAKKMKFKGETVLSDKQTILLLIDNLPKFRGMHTAGTGKVPNKEEAQYVLHTTIYIWNLHQK